MFKSRVKLPGAGAEPGAAGHKGGKRRGGKGGPPCSIWSADEEGLPPVGEEAPYSGLIPAHRGVKSETAPGERPAESSDGGSSGAATAAGCPAAGGSAGAKGPAAEAGTGSSAGGGAAGGSSTGTPKPAPAPATTADL